jgi:hypothetical protein
VDAEADIVFSIDALRIGSANLAPALHVHTQLSSKGALNGSTVVFLVGGAEF